MDPTLASPATQSFFDGAAVGAIYARSFVTVLVILALLGALHQAWRIRHVLRLLNQTSKIHGAGDQVAPCDASRDQKVQLPAPWQ